MEELTRHWEPRESGTAPGRPRARSPASLAASRRRSGLQRCQLPEDSEGEGDRFVVHSPLSKPDPFSSVTAGGDVQKRRLKRLQPLSLHGISFLTPRSHCPGRNASQKTDRTL